MSHLPFTFKFVPRPLLAPNDMEQYVVMYKDPEGEYHCCTNLVDPIAIAGYKEMIQVAFNNSFVKIETHFENKMKTKGDHQ